MAFSAMLAEGYMLIVPFAYQVQFGMDGQSRATDYSVNIIPVPSGFSQDTLIPEKTYRETPMQVQTLSYNKPKLQIFTKVIQSY